MPIHLEIQEAHIQPLIDFYLNRLKTLRDEIQLREKEMKEVNNTIQKLKKRDSQPLLLKSDTENTIKKAEYSDKWPWVKKISFAIDFHQKPLTTKEVVDTLTEF